MRKLLVREYKGRHRSRRVIDAPTLSNTPPPPANVMGRHARNLQWERIHRSASYGIR